MLCHRKDFSAYIVGGGTPLQGFRLDDYSQYSHHSFSMGEKEWWQKVNLTFLVFIYRGNKWESVANHFGLCL